MAVTGKNSLTLRKRDLDNEKTIAVGFTKLQAWHKATAGETGIDLLALNFPPEIVNETNPSNAKLAKAQLRKYAKNVTITSTLSGKLMREISYTIPNATRINWVGFTSAQDEVFEITIDYSASTELTVVDGKALICTGTLLAGVTDIPVGQPFPAGAYIDQQIGAVEVHIDGVQQFRNSGNLASPADGNYYEVNSGGVSNLIRMNTTSGADRDFSIKSIGIVAERPTVSQQADIEKVQGQVDAMIPTLAVAAGVPETDFQANPNNIDLKAFGDRVLQAEQDIVDNTNEIIDNTNEIIARHAFKGCIANNATTGIANNSWTTIINGTIDGTDGNYNNTTGIYTVLEDGVYHVIGNIEYPAFAIGGAYTMLIGIVVNTSFKATVQQSENPHSSFNRSRHISHNVIVNAGDTIYVQAFQNTGVLRGLSGGVQNFISIHKVSEKP